MKSTRARPGHEACCHHGPKSWVTHDDTPRDRTASSKRSRRAASTVPRAKPRKAERATVALSQRRWNRASKAASLPPHFSRQRTSPTDQLKAATVATAGNHKTISCRVAAQVTWARLRGPKKLCSVKPLAARSRCKEPATKTSAKTWTARRTPISPAW